MALLLILLIVVLLRGCGSSAPESTPETPAATKTTTKKSSKKTESVDEDEGTDEATDSADSDAAKANAKKKEDEVIKVKVSVAKGKTAWIEVKVDGKSVFGAQATGPFEQEYTPESSIEITTSKPSDVTVTKNGEKVRYDTKTSGVARVTITVPKKETTDSEDGESATAPILPTAPTPSLPTAPTPNLPTAPTRHPTARLQTIQMTIRTTATKAPRTERKNHG